MILLRRSVSLHHFLRRYGSAFSSVEDGRVEAQGRRAADLSPTVLESFAAHFSLTVHRCTERVSVHGVSVSHGPKLIDDPSIVSKDSMHY